MTSPGLVFKLVLISTLVLTLILSAEGAPAELKNEIAKNCTDDDGSKVEENEYEEIIDQSQNGTENYRISVKDVVVIWAPVNSFLAASALLESQLLGEDFLGSEDLSELTKPQLTENQPLIVDLMENKPLVQNSTESVVPEKENEKPAIINPTTKPAKLRRSGLNYPALIGPFLRRKH